MSLNPHDLEPPRPGLGDVLASKWFWGNVLLTLLLTAWVPLVTLTPRFVLQPDSDVPEDGANTVALSPMQTLPNGAEPLVQEGEPQRIPVYRCYAGVVRAAWRGEFQSRTFQVYGSAVLLHLALCFLISLWVWYVILRWRRPTRN